MSPESPGIQRLVLRAQAAAVFTPGAPIDKLALFRGRLTQVQRVLETVNQTGQHAIIYGERGVGKTSLVSVIDEIISKAGIVGLQFAHINCDAADDFQSLWRKIFRGLTVAAPPRQATVKLKDGEELNLDLPQTLAEWLGASITPDEVRRVASLTRAHLIIIIDEFDQLSHNANSIILISNTIKSLSDHRARVTLMLVGVADTVDQLISGHESIERSLVQVPMPRMSVDEIRQILEGGLQQLKISITEDALTEACSLAQGLPTAAHHIGLQVAYLMIDEQRTNVEKADLGNALNNVISGMGQSLLSDWTQATNSNRPDALFKHVLVACALAPRDELGWFQAAEVRDPFREVTNNKTYSIGAYSQHLHLLATQRGRVLDRTGEARKWQFRFRKPLFQSYAIMRALSLGMIHEDTLTKFKTNLPS